MKFKLGPLHAKRRAFFGKLMLVLLRRKNLENFNSATIKKIIFLRDNDKFGDLIVSTISFREAKKSGFNVDVIAGLHNATLIACNPYINNIYTHHDNLLSVIRLGLRLRHHDFDLLVDLRNEVPTHKDIVLMYLIKPRHVLGFNREKYPIFDVSIPEDFSLNKHAAHRNLGLLAALGIDCSDVALRYDVVIPEATERPVREFLCALPHSKTLLINLKGEGPYRCMSIEQVEAIVRWCFDAKQDINIVLSGKPGDLANLEISGIVKSPFSDYLSAVALVKNVDFIVSPDTSIVHAAAAFDKPLLALYTKDKTQVYLNSLVWGPNNPRARQMVSHDDAVYSIAPTLVVTQLSQLLTESCTA